MIIQPKASLHLGRGRAISHGILAAFPPHLCCVLLAPMESLPSRCQPTISRAEKRDPSGSEVFFFQQNQCGFKKNTGELNRKMMDVYPDIQDLSGIRSGRAFGGTVKCQGTKQLCGTLVK